MANNRFNRSRGIFGDSARPAEDLRNVPPDQANRLLVRQRNYLSAQWFTNNGFEGGGLVPEVKTDFLIIERKLIDPVKAAVH